MNFEERLAYLQWEGEMVYSISMTVILCLGTFFLRVAEECCHEDCHE